MKNNWIVLVCFSFSLAMCHHKKDTTKTDNQKDQTTEVKQTTQSTPAPKTIIANPEYQWPGSTDEFTILSQKINGDTLFVEVQYGGGCKEHVFTMHSSLRWAKSLPPQLNLFLEHENNDDNCRALLTETLQFDLQNCRYTPGNTAILILNGDREKKLTYKY